jgi:deazaflavin-dependent oxidoreductase (nitroreductase family)
VATKEERSFFSKLVGRLLLRVGIPFFVVVAALFVVLSRLQVRPYLDAVRALNKRVLNPLMMKMAGRRHWYASAIRHKGRRSGKEYATPVMAEPTPDGFTVPLPYGEGVDWLRNVRAAGRATIEAKGESYEVVEPAIVGYEEVAPLLPARLCRTWSLFGIERFLRVKRAPESPATNPRSTATASSRSSR